MSRVNRAIMIRVGSVSRPMRIGSNRLVMIWSFRFFIRRYALDARSGMQMEDFAHDLTFAIDYEQREHDCVTSAVQVGEFEPHGCDSVD